MSEAALSSALLVRLQRLRDTQNPDGGWAYFAGKRSWLEPTFYAALALHGEPAADRAWKLICSWQQPDGSVQPTANVETATWGAALLVTLGAVRREFDGPVGKATSWLLNSAGVEGTWPKQVAWRLGILNYERDLKYKGWPWLPGTTSWVEPTVHTLVALKKVAGKVPSAKLQERVSLGQGMLLDLRCRDGGWNYGNRSVLGVDLPSYPETTALALFGLQGQKNLDSALQLGSRMLAESRSPLERAWLTIALRLNGVSALLNYENSVPPADQQVLALEALALPGGNLELLRTERAA